ncbi:MAG: tRNA (N(6)-L-threonylcarbamoyladenosine (37)-C(2))-methylthiotransferase [Candidatus Methanolliviera sp. GoM_asphalt]|nr:MAG: tRNA (N(6)-L-threonylcarbamoyladenosine (37)-C(2))-methylthiotransferase [Candidatus Methanolliviera sp. GoM_asphalt]
MKIYIESHGCTANEEFARKLEDYLRKKRFEIIKDPKKADTVVLNTCTVIETTERAMLRKIRSFGGEEGEEKKLIVTGCMARIQSEEIKEANRDAIILDQRYFYDLFRKEEKNERIVAYNGKNGKIGTVSIGEGCIGDCSYCISKKARGDIKSRSPEEIIEEFKELIKRGVREIRLTGQDVGAYGIDISYDLPHLLERISRLDGDFYVRVGMMNPHSIKDILDDLILAFESDKIFKFIHIPVQSGSDKILRKMNRRYEVKDFLKIVDAFKSRFGDIGFSTDFIVGFPEESKEDFERSLELLNACEPNKVNITRYSQRPFTPYADVCIYGGIKKERSRIMTEEVKRIYKKINKRWVGRRVEGVITEKGTKGGLIARDIFYHQIIIVDKIPLGSMVNIKIEEDRTTYFMGRVI